MTLRVNLGIIFIPLFPPLQYLYVQYFLEKRLHLHTVFAKIGLMTGLCPAKTSPPVRREEQIWEAVG